MSYIQNIELMSSQNTKFVADYTFDPVNSAIILNESFTVIMYIVNLTTDDIIYNPLHKGRGGTISEKEIILDFPMTGMASSDSLIIATGANSDLPPTDQLLRDNVTQQKITNEIMSRAFNVIVEEEDIQTEDFK